MLVNQHNAQQRTSNNALIWLYSKRLSLY